MTQGQLDLRPPRKPAPARGKKGAIWRLLRASDPQNPVSPLDLDRHLYGLDVSRILRMAWERQPWAEEGIFVRKRDTLNPNGGKAYTVFWVDSTPPGKE